jgi:CheY-like chemotaxis protein
MQQVKRLLVIEDDAAMNLVLRDFLKSQGYIVYMASSATGALKVLNSLPPYEQPSLVLSDVKLGALSGIDLCKKLRQEYPILPVVLFSVFDQLEEEALSSGARKFLKKPFPLETLADTLEEQLFPSMSTYEPV